ncbi:MAG: MATE family efflux transporter [Oscillospiraceae bacterium]|nr:MATE family efflux transporter [Oscillospiraceae bacterium]
MSKEKSVFFQKYFVTDKAFYKKVLLILIPVVLQSCINQGVNMMDTIMVGQLGDTAIAASSQANQFYSLFQIFCMGLSAAGLVLTAQYFGAKDLHTVRRVFDLLLQLVIVLGAIFGVLTFLFPEQIMAIYVPKEPDVIALGAQYLRITAFIFIPHGIALVMANVARSVGNAKLGLYVAILSFAVNIGANYIFIFGKLGFPAMGVMGAALGTLVARIVELIVCAVYLLKVEKVLKYRPTKILKLPKPALFKEFKRLGLPAVISDALLGFAGTAISMIIGRMSKEVMGAWAIVMVVDRMCTVAIQGATSASGVVVGQTVGEGDFDRAQHEGWTFFFLSLGLGVIAGCLVLLVGEASIGLYNITPATHDVAVIMMEASALVVCFQAIQSTLSKGVLRGGGDTKFLMVADVLFQWCASIPLGILVGLVWNMSPFWVLIALRIDYFIKSVWLIFRLKSGKWIHKAKSIEA